MTAPSVHIHTADLVVPISAEPIPGGGVVVDGGRIVAVGPIDALVRRFPTAAATRWSGVLTPGLVNAHTHLQYTTFSDVGAEPHRTYTDWAVRFVEELRAREGDDWAAAARTGAEMMIEGGVTAIGDVVTNFECRDVLVELGIPGVAYLELIGIDIELWRGGVGADLRQAVEGGLVTAVNRVGISPHAPYSIEPPVLAEMAALARELDVRLHIHVAESDGEDDFYRNGTGSLSDRLRTVANRRVEVLERGGTGLGAAAFVASLGVLGPNCHIAHGVYLGADGRAIVAEAGTAVALCPRSNHVVGVDYPPVADFLTEAVPFAVGTDSLGSTPSLDLLADVAELRRLAVGGGYDGPDLDARLLHAATLGGAVALGLDAELGSLQVGKRADLAVFDVADLAELTSGGGGRCVATIIGGELRFGSQPSLPAGR